MVAQSIRPICWYAQESPKRVAFVPLRRCLEGPRVADSRFNSAQLSLPSRRSLPQPLVSVTAGAKLGHRWMVEETEVRVHRALPHCREFEEMSSAGGAVRE